MAKSITIKEDSLRAIRESMVGSSNTASHNTVCVTEAAPEVDEFELGQESDNPPVGGNYCHVNEAYNTSVRGDLDSINTIEFIPHEDAREEGYEGDEIDDFEPYYEIEAMDMDGNTILYADLTVEELFDYFPQSVINDIIERDKSGATRLSNPSINQYRIEDILYRDTTPSDVNNVEEVNRIAKKIQTGGPSAYLLTDGDIISFHDHIYITNVDGITPDKFIALGNIRLSNGGIELIKEPTREQMYRLKQWVRQQNGKIHIDFCEESHGTYPRTLFSTTYLSPNAERIVNDIYYYFEEGIRPQDNFYESKNNDNEVIIENTFEKWFGSSILKDENGQPLKMYHGTDAEFDSFSKEHIGRTGAYEGYGFNFTPFESRARGYNSKRVIEAYLRVVNPMTTKSYKISLRQLVEIIRQLDKGKPFTDTIVAAYEPARYNEKWDAMYYRRALPIAAKIIYNYNKENNYGDAGIYAEICLCGQSDKIETINVFERLGYDSAIFYDNNDRINTVVVFEPNQIKLTTNKTFNSNSDIMRESINKNANFYYNEGIKPQGNVQHEGKKIGGKSILTESQESKSIAAAKKLVMQRLNYNEQEADEFIRIKLRNDIPTLRTPQGGKFILGVARMFCDGELRTANDIGNLNSTLKLVASDAHINEYDRNLNGMSCQELVQRFAKAMSDNLEAEKAEIDQMAFNTPSDYEIVRIDSFEQSSQYGKYVSWCVTHQESMFNSYTSDGINQFYFCLKNGFKNVDEVPSEGCPLDEYGLSMIAVSVNENGMLNTCTCRWNHDNGGDDSIMNSKEVSQVIGANFFEVFKPNNKWKDLLTSVMQRLANGEDPRNVFDGVGDFREGFAEVQLNVKWNFINQEGRLLSDQWFDGAYDFSEGFAWVKLNGNEYKLDTSGNLSLFESKNKNKKIVVSENQLKTIKENLDFEVSSSEIDLSSFKKKHELVPNIWNPDGTLNSRVRLKLLDIADDFWEFVNLKWVKPSGIILTGSICNFNWSQYSDIDLHLIVDFDEIDEKTEFVRDYLDAKKNEWNNEHSGLQIMGYPVELYVQNLGEMPQSGGIYDLEENDWIKKPNSDDIKSIGLNKFPIKDKAAKIMTIIDDMYDALKSTSDSYEIEQIGDDAKYLWKKVKNMRKSSLAINAENGNGNIVYKYLRRQGYLDKLWKLRTMCYDKSNSITESKNKKKKYTVYIDGKKDDTFSDMNWKRKPKIGKGFYYGGAVFKIKEVTDDSIYAIEESKNTSAQLLTEWDKIDYFEKAKQYFGTTNDLNECGFILPNGEMLDLSSVKGRRGIPHRNVEAIGVGLETFIEHGAIRCDSRYKLINICKKPTKEQINRLTQIIKANDGSVSLDLGNGHVTFDYVDYKNANYKRIINDIINFFDNKIKPSSLYESKEVIKEYLEKDYNMPLYSYFKWAANATDFEKVQDLVYQCSYEAKQYIAKMSRQISEFEPLRLALIKDEDIMYDDEFVENIANIIVKNNLTDAFIYYLQVSSSEYELPSWLFMDFNRVVKNEWCIHFGADSESIAREGFTGGTEEIEHLAYTGAGQEKHGAGYDFAFPLGEKDIDFNEYGDEAVIFQTSGIEIYHHGDTQNQVIFWGPYAKNFIPIKYDSEIGDWCIYGMNNQILKSGSPSTILSWVLNNLPQYRKQIMAGKNGYIPKYYDYNQRKRVPYPIYRNESIQKYITLLKENLINEEVVADGNSEHNPYEKRWKAERKALKNFICNFGNVMTSRENGKQYKVYYDKVLSQLIGFNYCICLQWDPIQLKPSSTLYIRALDKFTNKIFQAQYDQRGKDNMLGTSDDLRYGNQQQNNYQYQ